MDDINFIVTAKHYSPDQTAKGYIRHNQQKLHLTRGIAINIVDIDKPHGDPVYARIWQSQWIADCECRGASFVDPEDPIFFCFSCGNRRNGGVVRPVIFPPEKERREIERLVLERPVDDRQGLTILERIGMAMPVLYKKLDNGEIAPLPRCWEPGQTLKELHEEQDVVIASWRRELKEGKKAVKNGN